MTLRAAAVGLIAACLLALPAQAQKPPGTGELEAYRDLHRAAWQGDVVTLQHLLRQGASPDPRDAAGRTPLHVAAFFAQHAGARALVAGGADPRAKEGQLYDIVTIAAVKDDVGTLRLALELGGDARAITSPYAGTALIAAAHLGHDEVVKILIAAGAPLDHVNNLGWTALIEAIVLGDGGRRHSETVRALLAAGARTDIADRNGATPLALARQRGYAAMIELLQRAGAR